MWKITEFCDLRGTGFVWTFLSNVWNVRNDVRSHDVKTLLHRSRGPLRGAYTGLVGTLTPRPSSRSHSTEGPGMGTNL